MGDSFARALIRILRNSVLVYAAEFFSRGLTLLVMIYAARALGVDWFGDLSFALGILAIVAALSDFGLSMLLLRRVAQDPTRARGAEPSGILVLKLAFACSWVGLTLAAMPGLSSQVFEFLGVAGVAVAVRAYAEVTGAVLRAVDKFHIDALLKSIHALVFAGAAAAALAYEPTPLSVAYALLLASLVEGAAARIANGRGGYVRLALPGLTHGGLYRSILRGALPFGALAVLGIVYFRVDVLMLQYMRGSAEVGLYSAAYRVLEGVLLLPWGFSVVLFPILSEALAGNDRVLAGRTVGLGMKVLTYVSLPVATVATLGAEELMGLLFPILEYQGSILGLQILIWAAVAVFLSATTSTLINSGPSPQVNTWIAAGMVVLNVGLNLLLIPPWGLAGAAAATVATEFGGLVTNSVYVHRRLLPLHYGFVVRPVIAAVGMAAGFLLLPSLLYVPVHIAIYVGILGASGALSGGAFGELRSVLATAPGPGSQRG